MPKTILEAMKGTRYENAGFPYWMGKALVNPAFFCIMLDDGVEPELVNVLYKKMSELSASI